MPTVEEYMHALPADVKPMLEKVRKAIREAAPKAKEEIGYHMPGYTYLGPLVYFAAYKNHCSLFGMSNRVIKKFEEELKPFKISGSTIQFTHHHPFPVTLLKKMVKERLKENEEKDQKKKEPKNSGALKKSRQPNKK